MQKCMRLAQQPVSGAAREYACAHRLRCCCVQRYIAQLRERLSRVAHGCTDSALDLDRIMAARVCPAVQEAVSVQVNQPVPPKPAVHLSVHTLNSLGPAALLGLLKSICLQREVEHRAALLSCLHPALYAWNTHRTDQSAAKPPASLWTTLLV